MSMFARRCRADSTGNIDQGHIVYYRASKRRLLALFIEQSAPRRLRAKITRDLDEDVRDRVRVLASTEAFQNSRRERKKWRCGVFLPI